jgi:hypothetical protein
MRRIAALGTALLIGGGLVAGATPAQAQPIACGPLIAPVCSLAARQLQNVEDELSRVPGYITYVEDTVYIVYDFADRTVRCTVFGQCT